MPASRRLPVVADLTLVTAGAMTANVAGYLLQLLAGRWLGVAGYSEFASLLAAQTLCAVPALALQNVVARQMVHGASVPAARALGRRCAAIVALLAAALVPAVAAGLHVSVAAASGALISAPLLVLLSTEQGILQGTHRFRTLATILGGSGILRAAPALITLATGAGAAPALWSAAAGLTLATTYAHRTTTPETLAPFPALRTGSSRPQGVRSAGKGAGVGGGVVAVVRAAQVQAALMALSSVDLIVARVVLGEADASRYALGAIATKIAFWLPQAVGVVLYPRMAQPQHSARAVRDALGVLSAVGVVAVVGAAVFAPLAPLFAGHDYAPIEGLLWLFALDGALLALLQGALLSAIAVDRTAPAVVTWIGLALEIVLALTVVGSLPALITLATVVTAAVTATIIVLVVLAVGRQTKGSPESTSGEPRERIG
ncbi:polysaccharide biosynthesis protein [Nocardia sp. NPDC051570]|uniref:polysaccharide biosynthesis protein n=1 Tax=Nocardia sp. NPDC051570 TaxID=3364324 RepID=UPI00378DFE0A